MNGQRWRRTVTVIGDLAAHLTRLGRRQDAAGVVHASDIAALAREIAALRVEVAALRAAIDTWKERP